MSLDELNAFSRQFAQALFSEWPEWEAFAVTERSEDQKGSDLVVRIPNPAGSNLEKPLTVCTDNGEVTVGLDWYHSHFAWSSDRPDFGADMTDPIPLLHALLDERQAVLIHFSGEQWKSSRLLTREECRASAYRSRPADSWLQDVDRFRVRSWRGTLDADGGY